MENSIKKFRKAAKMTQTALAQAVKYNRTNLSQLENGHIKSVSGPVMLRISKALGQRVEDVFFTSSVNQKQQ